MVFSYKLIYIGLGIYIVFVFGGKFFVWLGIYSATGCHIKNFRGLDLEFLILDFWVPKKYFPMVPDAHIRQATWYGY